ncbi:MAG: YebC/PmpR family DNA-binding transcriptional regulator [Lentisphaeria bacterium]|nr:YebC/PmpR family DNA-binding transcriptional regulator [Lentisphaeria bacterium]
MSGHSKWANIKHKKEAADKVKGKAFSRLGKEIMVAAKMGGGDPNANPRLRAALAAAKAANMPNANVERAIKKGLGELGDVVYEEIVYEGYGAGGVAVIVDCLTDNRNRSISEVRMAIERNNGNMAGSGAVARMFKRQAHFVISGEWADEDKLMDVVLENGANDLEVEDGVAEVWADPEFFEDLLKVFEEKGIPTDEAEVVRKPEMVTEITDVSIARQVMRMIDRLEELDDVQNVTSNYELSDAVAEELENEE